MNVAYGKSPLVVHKREIPNRAMEPSIPPMPIAKIKNSCFFRSLLMRFDIVDTIHRFQTCGLQSHSLSKHFPVRSLCTNLWPLFFHRSCKYNDDDVHQSISCGNVFHRSEEHTT